MSSCLSVSLSDILNIMCALRSPITDIFHLFLFQFLSYSISARALLFKQWQAALNPTCESSRSLNRLRALESCGNDREDTATAAELAFLSSSSVCWNRYVRTYMIQYVVVLKTSSTNTYFHFTSDVLFL